MSTGGLGQQDARVIDAERLAREIQQGVQQGLEQGLSAADQAITRDQIREMVDQIRDEVARARSDARAGSLQPPFTPDMIPREAVDISVAFFTMIAAIVIGLPLARAWARRMDRKGQAAPASEMAPRLDRIEQAVDAIAIEVERISENQRYSSKLMSELRGLPAANAVGWSPAREAEPLAREATEPRRP